MSQTDATQINLKPRRFVGQRGFRGIESFEGGVRRNDAGSPGVVAHQKGDDGALAGPLRWWKGEGLEQV